MNTSFVNYVSFGRTQEQKCTIWTTNNFVMPGEPFLPFSR